MQVGAGMLGNVAPVPGGIGVQEAALTAGLTSFGIPANPALATVIVFRAITFAIPPIFGFFTLRWLRKQGVRLRRRREALVHPIGVMPRIRRGVVQPKSPFTKGIVMTIGPSSTWSSPSPATSSTATIAPELAKLVDDGTIRIIDLVFITKDADGDFAAVEFDEHDGLSAFASIDGEIGGVISHEDVEHAAEALEPNSSAALLVWEDTWATPFVEAMRASGGVLVEGARIPHDLIEPVLAGLDS